MERLRFDGFLGTRASLMLDVVFLAMFVVLVALAVSIYLVRYRRSYLVHKRLQLLLGTVLLVTVALFEADMRVNGWMDRAEASRFYKPMAAPGWLLSTVYLKLLGRAEVPGLVFTSLGIHLFFAVTTSLLWIWVIVQALRRFPKPPAPGDHSASHKLWAWIAAIDMGMTAITGWIFYLLAFVA
jgi:putative membrane protein